MSSPVIIIEPNLPQVSSPAPRSPMVKVITKVLIVPLASVAFIADKVIRIVVNAVVTSKALVAFGCLGAHQGGSLVGVSAVRVVVEGWIAIGITYGLLKPFDTATQKKRKSLESNGTKQQQETKGKELAKTMAALFQNQMLPIQENLAKKVTPDI
ncbi:hypothetical protein COLO4_19392 [Corchorus olitorius]|uniref:Uncharacterized protein n=1 Tax=Corchorus olitorius TaxID=93759 RepID=A0A1R3J5L6_9ROSI|nr:hypothetical protein COLO4_19392 [Corchorus olitorius]